MPAPTMAAATRMVGMERVQPGSRAKCAASVGRMFTGNRSAGRIMADPSWSMDSASAEPWHVVVILAGKLSAH